MISNNPTVEFFLNIPSLTKSGTNALELPGLLQFSKEKLRCNKRSDGLFHAQVTWNVNIPPTPAWRSINNVSKLHRTLTSPPPHPTPPHPNVQRSISNMMKDQVHMSVIAPPHPTHPNVQRSMSNVMKPQNTVKTKGKRRWCKKTRARKREKHCKNPVQMDKGRKHHSKKQLFLPAPAPPPPGQHCREAENTVKNSTKCTISSVSAREHPVGGNNHKYRPSHKFNKFINKFEVEHS